ncbi:M23 family metallopeptidase [Microcystis aeruginosa EAWAG127a]|uniref:M23 family metallopeptidase n=1 Tax=Microcystis aeruginosa EAWAG127a TaxID=2529855 RepID=A0A5J5LQ71_MICAE|nr:M23 family metallopeptidase [Microcystis aeruginosa]KAB0239783.1 M23 family metallopeptidase [Microcystis aeruginosa EAWAG127a]
MLKYLPVKFLRFLAISCLVTLISLGFDRLHPVKANPTLIAQNAWAGASFPVENFQTYTSGFGYRSSPMDGSQQFHAGLDLAAPLGSYIRNWWTGRIIELSDHTGCGTMIKMQSGQWTHIYCHLMGSVQSDSRGTFLIDRSGGIVLTLGQDIPAGARMARVGMTGRTTGPHLHWGLMYGNQYVDPALVLNAMYGSNPSGNS